VDAVSGPVAKDLAICKNTRNTEAVTDRTIGSPQCPLTAQPCPKRSQRHAMFARIVWCRSK